ncbi:DUF6000 family protein [Streptosporangium lutulentum]|uniref:CdiI immunity protein domain-containing protein n=1 Tax=Streptosporangium lutulentum TaxID=1461250 RepID=A0ABT9QP06_9ACTN|nr:DUF6000 family protein [Streptosporangium lutulentum]MDP9847744.1 hypothetical protein [Streptosporangium lutulentum]
MTDPIDDPEFEVFERYMIGTPESETGRYLDLLHGNFLDLPDWRQADFLQALGRDARQVTDAELECMLAPGEFAGWRERLTAAWLIGLDRRIRFRGVLTDLLLESDLVYAGQGYSFALTRFGQSEDADVLAAYLERYLSQRDCHYDQDWVLGGLLHLDEVLGMDRAADFLVPGGLWSGSSFSHQDPADCHLRITELLRFAERAMGVGA